MSIIIRIINLKRGTDAIMKSLKMHLEEPVASADTESKSELGGASGKGGNGEQSIPAELKTDIIKATRTLDYSCKKSNELPVSLIKLSKQYSIHTINLTKNQIKTLPDEIETLNESLTNLNYSFNQLASLPIVISKLKNLIVVDLRANQLTQLDENFKNLESLRELIIADNR